MDEARYRQFLTTLETAYCEALGRRGIDDATGEDGYEVFARVFGMDDITPEKIHAAQISRAQLTRIRDAARSWHETDAIELKDIQEAVRLALYRWPPDAT